MTAQHAVRVVPDVNVLVQALLRLEGPAGQLMHLAWEARLEFVVSPTLMNEMEATLAKPRMRDRF